jgi:hypothetical protein
MLSDNIFVYIVGQYRVLVFCLRTVTIMYYIAELDAFFRYPHPDPNHNQQELCTNFVRTWKF